MVSQFLIGCQVPLKMFVTLLYVMECAPDEHRGTIIWTIANTLKTTPNFRFYFDRSHFLGRYRTGFHVSLCPLYMCGLCESWKVVCKPSWGDKLNTYAKWGLVFDGYRFETEGWVRKYGKWEWHLALSVQNFAFASLQVCSCISKCARKRKHMVYFSVDCTDKVVSNTYSKRPWALLFLARYQSFAWTCGCPSLQSGSWGKIRWKKLRMQLSSITGRTVH